jgi:tRNA 2-thiouridine synthesizing protein B
MAMLHTVNKSPFERNSLKSCLQHASSGSAVLMFEDGIYGALNGTSVSDMVKDAAKNLSLYVLGPDLKARGMSEDKVIDGVSIIDYDRFVDLVTDNEKVQSWL